MRPPVESRVATQESRPRREEGHRRLQAWAGCQFRYPKPKAVLQDFRGRSLRTRSLPILLVLVPTKIRVYLPVSAPRSPRIELGFDEPEAVVAISQVAAQSAGAAGLVIAPAQAEVARSADLLKSEKA